MNYSEKIKQFVGKEGDWHRGNESSSYTCFYIRENSNKDTIEEVGEDYIVINREASNLESVIVPLNRLVVFY